jgi:hypothetical protein
MIALLAVGFISLAASPDAGVVATLGDTTMRVREGHRPSGGGMAPLLLEECTGTSCRPFNCAHEAWEGKPHLPMPMTTLPDGPELQPTEALMFLDGYAPWPDRPDQALIQYREMGSGAIAHYFLLKLTAKGPTCADFTVPPPKEHAGPREEQLWGNYQLTADGGLEWSAGLYAKGDPHACRACPPKSVALCTWQLEPDGFRGGACQRMSPQAWETRIKRPPH